MFQRPQTKTAKEVAVAAATELATIWEPSQDANDAQLLRERMRRWCDRYGGELSRHVSQGDATRFRELTGDLDYRMDVGADVRELLFGVSVFLNALAADIDTHPTDYSRPRPIGASVPRASGGSLAMPDKITWSWLVHHVPVSWWVTASAALLTLLVFAFWFGHVTPDSSWLIRLLKTPA